MQIHERIDHRRQLYHAAALHYNSDHLLSQFKQNQTPWSSPPQHWSKTCCWFQHLYRLALRNSLRELKQCVASEAFHDSLPVVKYLEHKLAFWLEVNGISCLWKLGFKVPYSINYEWQLFCLVMTVRWGLTTFDWPPAQIRVWFISCCSILTDAEKHMRSRFF